MTSPDPDRLQGHQAVHQSPPVLEDLVEPPGNWVPAPFDPQGLSSYGAFHGHGGTPIAGWFGFHGEFHLEMDDDWGVALF